MNNGQDIFGIFNDLAKKIDDTLSSPEVKKAADSVNETAGRVIKNASAAVTEVASEIRKKAQEYKSNNFSTGNAQKQTPPTENKDCGCKDKTETAPAGKSYFCDGADKAPQRSLFNALGMTHEEMRRPLVGIVSSYNEIVPGHMNIDKLVEAVKLGVAMNGGTPVVFPAIAVCDGIAMGHQGMKYSLVTRDLIADSTECMALAHHFDALVMIPNCDKNVPGLLMAAARVNVPTVFVSGGPMLAGHVQGHKTSLSSMFEAVGSFTAVSSLGFC